MKVNLNVWSKGTTLNLTGSEKELNRMMEIREKFLKVPTRKRITKKEVTDEAGGISKG